MIGLGINNFDTLVNLYNNHYHTNSCFNTGYYLSSEMDSFLPSCRFSFFSTGEDYATKMIMESEGATALAILIIGVIVCAFLFLRLNFYKIVVTDKRIYGKVAFGKRVDLPIDFITSVAKIQGFKGVTILSSSKKTKFILIKNVEKVYNEINNLLVERQKSKTPVNITVEPKNDTHDDLIKLKELLDMGVITQEEFDAKKTQVLGL